MPSTKDINIYNKTDVNIYVREQEIQERAYFIYLETGSTDQEQNWFTAKKELEIETYLQLVKLGVDYLSRYIMRNDAVKDLSYLGYNCYIAASQAKRGDNPVIVHHFDNLNLMSLFIVPCKNGINNYENAIHAFFSPKANDANKVVETCSDAGGSHHEDYSSFINYMSECVI